nr:MAG TPA: hypothetical protein [Caudoviricetes sp.]
MEKFKKIRAGWWPALLVTFNGRIWKGGIN